MVRGRFEHLEPERQEAILRVAAEEFAERGYDAASLNRIIDRAGMSKGSLYYYFDDKTDLFSTVVERATAMMVRLVGGFTLEDLTPETYWPAFDQLVRRSMDYLQRNIWYVKLARSFYRLGNRRTGPTAHVYEWARGWTARAIARGQQLHAVRCDLPLALLVELALAVGQAADSWVLERWERLSPEEREQLVAAELDAFHRLLAPAAR